MVAGAYLLTTTLFDGRIAVAITLLVVIRVAVSGARSCAALEAALGSMNHLGETAVENFAALSMGSASHFGQHLALMMSGCCSASWSASYRASGARTASRCCCPSPSAWTRFRPSSSCPACTGGPSSAGLTTSILFNIPGEPSSVATTFDGYPMAERGRPRSARRCVCRRHSARSSA